MTKVVLLSAVLSVGIGLGLMMPSAQAGMPVSAFERDNEISDVVQRAAWRCGPRRCWWAPGYVGVIPNYAQTWGPPHSPNCYWRRGLLGNWKYKCD